MKFISFLWRQRTLWLTVLFTVIVGYTDHNSIWHIVQQWRSNTELKDEIRLLDEEFDANTEQYERLKSSQEAVEEVARMTLMMKSDDEDIYIVETKE